MSISIALTSTEEDTPPPNQFEYVYDGNDDDNEDDEDDGKYDNNDDNDQDYDNAEHEIQDRTHKINFQLAKLADSSSFRNRTASRMAYDLFRSQDHPDTVSYNTVLKALARTSSLQNKQAAGLAQDLLEEMEDIHYQQTLQNQQWYQAMDSQQLTQEELSRGPPRIRVKPNARSYSTVMDVWAKQSNPSAARRAELLLDRLIDKYEETGDVAMQPNVVSYNTVINAWAKAGANVEGAERAQALLEEMEAPDVISYNGVLHAWARSGAPNAGVIAEAILRRMMDENEGSPSVRPNSRSFSTAMDAWSRSHKGRQDSAERAHALLTELEELAEWEPAMKPSYVTYSTVINAYAYSKSEPLKAHKAFSILKKMNQLFKETGDTSVRPNRVTYNIVLNACATSCPMAVRDHMEEQDLDTKLPSLPDMVRTIYQQITEENSPIQADHFTFGTVLKAVANLFWGEPDQVEFGKDVFQEACARGQVSFGVLVHLRQAIPVDTFRELLPDAAVSQKRAEPLMRHIPSEWTRNVREDGRGRRAPNNRSNSGSHGGGSPKER